MNGEHWTPGTLLETSGSYWRACALHAGLRLGLFTLLDGGPLGASKAAERIGGKGRGVEMLLDALSAMGLLVKEAGGYRDSASAAEFLSKGSPAYMGHILLHHHNLMGAWARLHEAVLSGEPIENAPSASEEEEREAFLMGMFNLANLLAPQIVTAVDLSGRTRLLDLGGGPGTYAAHFCLKNPRLEAVVFDLPESRPFAEKTAARFGLEGRVEFRAGDFLEDPVGGKFDAAWLSHILHGQGPEECRTILAKAAGALETGGLLLVHEFVLEDSMDSPLHPALFSLNMLLVTEKGRAYSEGQLREMMEAAGAREVKRLAFKGPNDSAILQGVV